MKPEHGGFQPGQWVLVRHEGPEKFQAKWYGPYYVVKAHPLGTYQLRDPHGNILQHLINGQRLFHANVGNVDPTQLWSSATMQAKLKRQNIDWAKPTKEVQMILDKDGPLQPTYEELASLSQREWKEMECTGVRNILSEEGNTDLPRGTTTTARNNVTTPKDKARKRHRKKPDTQTTPNNPIEHPMPLVQHSQQAPTTTTIHDSNAHQNTSPVTSEHYTQGSDPDSDAERGGNITLEDIAQGNEVSRDVRRLTRSTSKRENIHTRRVASTRKPLMVQGNDEETYPIIPDSARDPGERVAGAMLKDASNTPATPEVAPSMSSGSPARQELHSAASNTREMRGLQSPSRHDESEERTRYTTHYELRKRPARKKLF